MGALRLVVIFLPGLSGQGKIKKPGEITSVINMVRDQR
jgi:hypothetical protein